METPTLGEMADELRLLHGAMCDIVDFIYDERDWQRQGRVEDMKDRLVKVGQVMSQHRKAE